MPEDDFREDIGSETIFAPETPQDPSAASERPLQPHPPPSAAAQEQDGADSNPRRHGMGRWFIGVALCMLGTGYIVYQVLSTAPYSRDATSSAADDRPATGQDSQTAAKGETIYKLPRSPPPDAPPEPEPEPQLYTVPGQPPVVVEPDVVESPPAAPEPEPQQTAVEVGPDVAKPPPTTAQASAAPEQTGAEEIDTARVAGIDPAPAIITPPTSALQVIRDCQQCPELVVIPAGIFSMGSPVSESGHQQHEAPQHEVAIASPFAIGRFEVTFLEWDMCVSEGSCSHQAPDEGWGRERRPAINVSWKDISEQFLPWLARKSGKTYRLPSEAEWEYAVRASPGPAVNTAYGVASQANALCGFANAADDALGTGTGWEGIDCRDGFANTAPVGSFKPNRWGLHDLAGNVWEWVEDCWNATYGDAPSDGSAWTSGDCGLRVVRGGSWSSEAEKLRAADRGWNRPGARSPSIGFRVARKL